MQDHVLAIDYGTKRVGLAISRYSLAQPLTILDNDEELFEEITDIIEAESVEKILVGISENEMAFKTREFIKELKMMTKVPVVEVDETLSSHETITKLADSSLPLKRKQAPIDHFAAAHFLQEWLDEN